jgi:hypothetical protein
MKKISLISCSSQKDLMKHSSILKVPCKLLLLLKGFTKLVFLIFFLSPGLNDSGLCYVLSAFFCLVTFLCANKGLQTVVLFPFVLQFYV